MDKSSNSKYPVQSFRLSPVIVDMLDQLQERIGAGNRREVMDAAVRELHRVYFGTEKNPEKKPRK